MSNVPSNVPSNVKNTIQIIENNSAIREELDLAIVTAKSYPRNIEEIFNEIKTSISLNNDYAKSLWYTIPRDGKVIEGASIRLAELFLSAWGNIRVQSRIKEITDTYVTAEAIVFDMEKNIAISKEVRRKIIDKRGYKYSEDMITITAQACSSIAIRNALFTVIPKIYIISALNYAKELSLMHPNEKGKTINDIFEDIINQFIKLGLKKEDILKHLKKNDKTINKDDIIYLRGVLNAIKDGYMKPEELKEVERVNNLDIQLC